MKDTKEAHDSSLNKIAGNPNAPERKPHKYPRQLTLVEKRSLEASVSIAFLCSSYEGSRHRY